jgi:outer membrane protein OmpA-like peptidoglycan-associated protein
MNKHNLTIEEQKQFENGIILVKGKHMNRTALGVVDAMLTLYPNLTFAELKQMLPDSINPSAPKNYKSLFAPYNPERKYGVIQSGIIRKESSDSGLDVGSSHFVGENETFFLKDGTEVLVSKSWESADTLTGENDLQNLINHVKQYGIIVNSFEPKTEPFKKGSYELHIINSALFSKLIDGKSTEKKKIPFWIWIILGLILLILALLFAGVFKSEPIIIEKEVVKTDTIIKTVIQKDTVFINEIEKIETKFNAIQFAVGKADLPEDAKYALYDLAKIMQQKPSIDLKVEGHTSNEGDPGFNQKLSEDRAKAVVDFLVTRGVELSRFTYEGKGSSMPIDNNNQERNRRTEFVVIEK